MKNIKDITISIFAIIGFAFLLSSFTPTGAEQQVYGTPESHVWEFHTGTFADGGGTAFSINKVTGEVRKYDSRYTHINSKEGEQYFNTYRVTEAK
ncbi:hypothetical protein N9796_00160 [bacterium]|nr:hypothetical protein [bacterium]